jgi:hypothetical protein
LLREFAGKFAPSDAPRSAMEKADSKSALLFLDLKQIAVNQSESNPKTKISTDKLKPVKTH